MCPNIFGPMLNILDDLKNNQQRMGTYLLCPSADRFFWRGRHIAVSSFYNEKKAWFCACTQWSLSIEKNVTINVCNCNCNCPIRKLVENRTRLILYDRTLKLLQRKIYAGKAETIRRKSGNWIYRRKFEFLWELSNLLAIGIYDH